MTVLVCAAVRMHVFLFMRVRMVMKSVRRLIMAVHMLVPVIQPGSFCGRVRVRVRCISAAFLMPVNQHPHVRSGDAAAFRFFRLKFNSRDLQLLQRVQSVVRSNF